MWCAISVLFFTYPADIGFVKDTFLSFLVPQDGAGSETVLLLFHILPDFAVCFLVYCRIFFFFYGVHF